jgi:cytochrome b
MLEGPLAKHVSKHASDVLSGIHEANFVVLATLVAVHIAAALFYLIVKRDNLILPMFTGRKHAPAGAAVRSGQGGPLWLAVVLVALCGLAVWMVVR